MLRMPAATAMDVTRLDVARMRLAAAGATTLLRSLAHEDRLLLLCQLSQGERCVGDLEAELDLRQPGLSQHLGVLRREGLVRTRREGRRIYYRVADGRVLAVLKTLYELFCDNGDKAS